MRILLVEDETKVADMVARGLKAERYAVDVAHDGGDGWDMAAAYDYDLVILDLMLPRLNGTEILQRIRRKNQVVPILILTARDATEEKVRNFDAGADDYLTKPFGASELLARIRVLLRRVGGTPTPDVIEVGPIRIDQPRHAVTVDGQEVHLTPIEFRLLLELARQPGRVLTHRQLLREIWGPNAVDEVHYLRVHMGALRRKIEADPARPRWLLTEAGVGYRLREPTAPEPA